MKKNKIFKLILIAIALGTIFLLFLFFKNIIIDVVKLAKVNDEEGISELLKEKGVWGLLIVPIIEAMQMIVIFISAEPIQIASGISYPWWLSIPLCVIGVCFGATLIFILVRLIKLDTSSINQLKKIEDINKKKKKQNGMQALMYLLFVMPVIPFGAICYFASNSKIKFRRYIFTCATGVIPSIVTSIFMGKLFIFCASEGISIWILILCIFLTGGILLLSALFILRKFFLNDEGSLESPIYSFFLNVFYILARMKNKVEIDKTGVGNLKGPFVIISNHETFYDFCFAGKLVYPERFHIVCNRYYFRMRIFRFVAKKIEIIPKKLFNPDLETIKQTLKYVKNDESILIYPEGRLCVDGTTYKVVEGTGALFKKLGIPIIITNVEGGYLAIPKWRDKRHRGKIKYGVKDIIKSDEISEMTPLEIENRINEKLKVNEFEYARNNNIEYNSKNKANGLDGILYYCPNCGETYSLVASKNSIECSHCHTKLEIDNNYSFKDNELGIKDIHEFYKIQSNYERSILDSSSDEDILIECDVNAKILNMNNKKLDNTVNGTCSLTKQEFKFTSTDHPECSFSYTIKQLQALAFSCNKEFECYYKDDLYYFYPIQNKLQCARWAVLVDEMNNNKE